MLPRLDCLLFVLLGRLFVFRFCGGAGGICPSGTGAPNSSRAWAGIGATRFWLPPRLPMLRNAAAVLTAIMLTAEERMRRGLTCCPGIKGGGAGIAPLKGTGAPFPAPYPGMGIGDTRSLLLLGRPTPEAGVGGV